MSTERSRRSSWIELFREPLFVATTCVGTVVLALGIAFLILGVSMTTTPPAPYFQSMTDKLALTGASLATILVGLGLIRLAARIGGW